MSKTVRDYYDARAEQEWNRLFQDAYFFLPNELRELFERKGVLTLEMATCEGLSSHLQEQTNAIFNDQAKWNRWLEIILQTCNDAHLLG